MSSTTLNSKNSKYQAESIKTVCQLFEEQAKKAPNNPAIEYKNKTFSYQELNEVTNQLARTIRHQYQIIAGHELTADTLIPISVERSADYVIGILAILKAGGAYVPINPEYPDNRIQHILTDIQSQILITTNYFYSKKFKAINFPLQPLFIEEKPFQQEEKSNLNLPIKATDLAYVIYTSGSSGTPKGVMAHHITALSQTVCASYFKADSTDTVTFFSDVSFDSTTVEIWGALLHGARLFIPENLFELLSNPKAFKETLLSKKITITLLTRALFDLLYTLDESVFASLKCLMVGGEALTKNIMLQLLNSKHKPAQIINAYGPTENSTFCTTYSLEEDFSHLNSVPIGRPYSNRVGFVLDKHLQLMPIGALGELYVGGPSLSRGYLNQPQLTQEKFIQNPFLKESGDAYARIYKTGDLVKWLPEGNLEYVGRNDFQVKLRGYRIELTEIETRLLEFPDVQHGVILLAENEGFSYLACYYVATQPLNEELIRQHLAANLPDYMIPSVFIHLNALPVTTNGKLDRKALPKAHYNPTNNSNNAVHEEPVEQKIAAIWSRVLNVPKLNRDKSFFELGGNSLIAMSIRKELEDTFTIQLNVVELFIHTTLAQLAQRVSELMSTSSIPSLEEKFTPKEMPLSDCSLNEPIAVVGMACRLPGVENVDTFWKLLINEESNLVDFSMEELKAHGVPEASLANPNYIKRGALFKNAFAFDAGFFGYSVKDAELMDPQHRQFLECSWEALEASGNVPEKFKGEIGVFASQGRNFYFMDHVYSNPNYATDTNLFQALLGNEKDFLSTRVSFKLNLTGPSVTLQTACSSSLVSIQMACDNLKTQNCDMALAGGVSLFYNPGYPYAEDLIESPDGYCRAFDAKAQGTVVTSGVAVVVLKRLSDAIEQKDSIYALIKGGALNNDGASKMAFTAPSVQGQSAVIEKALQKANVQADSISYIEAHGTGTTLGDPIEWTALHQVYQKYTQQKEFCTLGAVKTNIGHTDSAAGAFGFIKTVLALKHQQLPATLNFNSLNPEIASFNTLFKVSNRTCAWESSNSKRRAAISSFGLGGTNAHLILEEYEEQKLNPPAFKSTYHLLPFSAKNKEALYAMAGSLKNYLAQANAEDGPHLAFTAQQGRAEFKERGYFLLQDKKDSGSISIQTTYLHDKDSQDNPAVICVLSDFQCLSVKQADSLYTHYPPFREAFNQCKTLIQEKIGLDLTIEKDDLTTSQKRLLSFTTQYALMQLFLAIPINLETLIAHESSKLLAHVLESQCSLSQALDTLIQNNFSQSSTEIKVSLFKDKLGKTKTCIFVEIGQGNSKTQQPCINLTPTCHESLEEQFLKSVGWLWSHGVAMHWEKINPLSHYAKKISMPTYHFTHRHYEIKKYQTPVDANHNKEPAQQIPRKDSAKMQLQEIWGHVLGVSSEELTETSHFIELGGDSLSFIDLLKHIEKSFHIHLKLNEVLEHCEFQAMLRHLESKKVSHDFCI